MKKRLPPEVSARIFDNVYICRNCGAKIRTKNPEKTKCRKCGSKKLRPKAKERRGVSK
jgi:large subunit ribosomal protein L40e